MSLDTFVYWKQEVPTHEEIQQCLEDYCRGIGVVAWDDGTGRWFVDLPGKSSFPFARVGPSSRQRRQMEIERSRERQFEVWLDNECLDVITREMDEITHNISRGFAVLVARGWEGRLEYG